MVALPVTFVNGDPVDAADLNLVATTLADAQDQIRNANIVADAGIDKSKLAQAFLPFEHGTILIPHTSGTDLSTTTMFTIGGAGAQTEIYRERITLAAGERASLCYLEFFVLDITAGGGGEYPVLDVLVDGVQVSGESLQLDTDGAYYSFGSIPPISNPLMPLADGSLISYRLGKSGAGTPSIRGLYLTRRVVKKDLVA